VSALITDLYELTMAAAYLAAGMEEREASFSMTFRESPFDGGYTVACGLGPVVEFLENFRFEPDEVDYLASLEGNDGKPLFSRAFLAHLGELEFRCDVDAVVEGSVVFPHEPLVRVTGPILQAQIVESAILNIVNFQSLIATKASRVATAAKGGRVLEFGLRRAHGLDGALAASRASYIGGCAATSNVLAGQRFGIPVAGTLAHSFIMAFDDELESFEAFAAAMPNNAILLVDTYDTLEGVRRAARVGRALEEKGHRFAGVRIDSGDLAYLSIEARRILDEAGLGEAQIAASNDLDEYLVESLIEQGARIDLWGVGTRLVTAWDQPALGGVYKLNAIRGEGGEWMPRIKLSEQAAKTSNPGLLCIRRYSEGGECIGDLIYDENDPPPPAATIIDPLDPTRRKKLPAAADREELLVPVMRGGRRLAPLPSPAAVRERVASELRRFHPGVRRFVNPHRYPAGLDEELHRKKTAMILALREGQKP
jgi:nicotinate phosphoribosyltransferase